MNYPNDMDNEMILLCDALNSIESVETKFSCCGHGKETWYVSMKVENISVMHYIIERFSKVGELQFHFVFFDNDPYRGHLGIYSEPLGMMSDFMRNAYHQWLIYQVEKVKTSEYTSL